LCIEDVCPAPALGSVLVGKLSILQVVGQSDLIRQTAVHENVGSTPKLFAPGPIFGLPPEDLFQA
jgi:hypothetical protein